MQQRISFVGGGNLAASLIGGLIEAGTPAKQISVADPSMASRQRLAKDFGVQVSDDNCSACDQADIVVLAVKPQVMASVCEDISDLVTRAQPMVISVAAGIDTQTLSRWLDPLAAIVRIMPNTPALIGEGASGVFANSHVTKDQQAIAMAIAEAVGVAVWVEDETLMDVVTAVSGSGPAYFFLAIEALQAAAEAQGLAPEVARTLAGQTALGAARLASHSEEPVAELRRRVTSPGGTTEAALSVLEQGGFRQLMKDAVSGAVERSRTLSRELSGKDQA